MAVFGDDGGGRRVRNPPFVRGLVAITKIKGLGVRDGDNTCTGMGLRQNLAIPVALCCLDVFLSVGCEVGCRLFSLACVSPLAGFLVGLGRV